MYTDVYSVWLLPRVYSFFTHSPSYNMVCKASKKNAGMFTDCYNNGKSNHCWKWHTFKHQYKLMRCSKNKCCKQCRHVKFKGTMTKLPVQKQTLRTAQTYTEPQDATDIQSQLFFVFFRFFYFVLYKWCLKWFLQEMLSYRLGTVNYFHWAFKPVLSYSKQHTLSTFFGEPN